MARRPIDDGLYLDQVWRSKRDPARRVVIVMIHRKDREVRYYKWGPNIIKKLAATHMMEIRELRRDYEPLDIYIK